MSGRGRELEGRARGDMGTMYVIRYRLLLKSPRKKLRLCIVSPHRLKVAVTLLHCLFE